VSWIGIAFLIAKCVI